MSEPNKELLAQLLREYPTWGDAAIAERERATFAEAQLGEALEALVWFGCSRDGYCPDCGAADCEELGQHDSACRLHRLSPTEPAGEPEKCFECGRDLRGYRGPLCRYCDPTADCE